MEHDDEENLDDAIPEQDEPNEGQATPNPSPKPGLEYVAR